MPRWTFKINPLLFFKKKKNIWWKGKKEIKWPYIHHSNYSQALKLQYNTVVNIPQEFQRITFTQGEYHQ